MQEIKRLAVFLWFAVLLGGVYYSRTTTTADGSSQWTVSGLNLLIVGLLIALVIWSVRTYHLLRLWLHEQGLFDQQARLPIQLKFWPPFVICFFVFSQTSNSIMAGASIEVTYGWGDPVAGPLCFLLIGLFLIVMQVYRILQTHTHRNYPIRSQHRLSD